MKYDKFGRKVSEATGKRLPTWNYLKNRRNKLIEDLGIVEMQLLEHQKDEVFQLYIINKKVKL